MKDLAYSGLGRSSERDKYGQMIGLFYVVTFICNLYYRKDFLGRIFYTKQKPRWRAKTYLSISIYIYFLDNLSFYLVNQSLFV